MSLGVQGRHEFGGNIAAKSPFAMFECLFQGAAAEHRPRAQCPILQRSCLSEHPSRSRWRPNPCTQNRLCKQPLTEPNLDHHNSTCEAGGHILICVCLSLSFYVPTPAASTSPAAAPGEAPAPSQATPAELHPSGSLHHSHQCTTRWSSHQQPTTCGPTIPGPGTTLPQLPGLSRVSFPSQHPYFWVQID